MPNKLYAADAFHLLLILLSSAVGRHLRAQSIALLLTLFSFLHPLSTWLANIYFTFSSHLSIYKLIFSFLLFTLQ